MKKSTIITIFIIYVASIIAIGFFGIKVKIYDEVKYVKSITITAEAEDESMFNLAYTGKNATTGNNDYELTIDYTKFSVGKFEENGELVDKNYLFLSIIPQVTYDSGELADARGEKIVYSTLNSNYVQKGFFSINEYGSLTVFRQGSFSFTLLVNPETTSGFGTGAKIIVYVVNGL